MAKNGRCHGKFKYLCEDEARGAIARRQHSKRDPAPPLRIYFHADCGCFHLTKQADPTCNPIGVVLDGANREEKE